MRHIKTYENIENRPKLGDYVICYEKHRGDDFENFIFNNVGKIVLTDYDGDKNYDYLVQYDSVPKKLIEFFDMYGVQNSRPMDRYEIIHFSENKKDLEDIIKMMTDVNKYNL